MSKKAGAVPVETRAAILKSAKEEFLSLGFDKASLRSICKKAGVTTGALYFFFDGKDDLFEKVISSVTGPFNEMMKSHYASERDFLEKNLSDNEQNDVDISMMLIDFYFQNKDVFDIILKHKNHPAVAKFLDDFNDYSTGHYLFLLSMAKKAEGKKEEVDPFALHQFVHMQTDTMLTLISHDFTPEEMKEHSEVVTRMLRGAFTVLAAE